MPGGGFFEGLARGMQFFTPNMIQLAQLKAEKRKSKKEAKARSDNLALEDRRVRAAEESARSQADIARGTLALQQSSEEARRSETDRELKLKEDQSALARILGIGELDLKKLAEQRNATNSDRDFALREAGQRQAAEQAKLDSEFRLKALSSEERRFYAQKAADWALAGLTHQQRMDLQKNQNQADLEKMAVEMGYRMEQQMQEFGIQSSLQAQRIAGEREARGEARQDVAAQRVTDLQDALAAERISAVYRQNTTVDPATGKVTVDFDAIDAHLREHNPKEAAAAILALAGNSNDPAAIGTAIQRYEAMQAATGRVRSEQDKKKDEEALEFGADYRAVWEAIGDPSTAKRATREEVIKALQGAESRMPLFMRRLPNKQKELDRLRRKYGLIGSESSVDPGSRSPWGRNQ